MVGGTEPGPGRCRDQPRVSLELRDVNGSLLGRWDVFGPPGQSEDDLNLLTLPTLPDDLRDSWPDRDAFLADFKLTLVDLGPDASYADFRLKPPATIHTATTPGPHQTRAPDSDGSSDLMMI